jgi:hypothetical protein
VRLQVSAFPSNQKPVRKVPQKRVGYDEDGFDKILEDEVMNIEIHDAAVEARTQKLLRASGSSSVEEVLLRLVETQEEQDRWLLENRTTVNAKIRIGIDQLDRGEGIPDDRLDAHLATLKNQT